MTSQVNDFYEFGEFRLDPVRRVLLRGSEPVAVTPKAIDTLLVLIEGRDRVMEKDELMRRVWPDAIVEEVGLAKHISALRKAFGERLGEHRYIVTVPGRGYRFVADVTVGRPGAGAAAVPAIHAAPPAAAPPTAVAVPATVSAPPPGAAVKTPSPSARLRPARAIAARYPALLAAFGLVIAALMASAYFADARRPAAAPLTARDTILLAGFVNRTDDPIFGETLRQGLAAQLEQSPFLNLLAEDRARTSLRLLGHSPDAPMTKEIATELCRREGLKAFVSGTIAQVGGHFAITLEAIDHNGGTMAREQVEAASKEDVLRALAQAAGRLRERLGESIGSVRTFNVNVTTSSLEAFKAHGQGLDLAQRGRHREAIASYRRAIELDPNFASAHMTLALSYSNTGEMDRAAEASRAAYALRDRVSEYERGRITHIYHLLVTGDVETLIGALERHQQTYPRDARAYASLASAYLRIGDFEKGIEAARKAIQLNPNPASPYGNLAQALLRLGRYDEASQVVGQAIERLKIEGDPIRRIKFSLAFVRGDAAAMRREIEAMKGKPGEQLAFALEAGAAAFSGRWRESEALSRRAVDLAAGSRANAAAGQFAAEAALRAAVVGQCSRSTAWATESLALDAEQQSLSTVALALAECSQSRRAQASIEALSTRFPNGTVIQAIWLPIIRASLEQQRGGAAAAISLMEPVARYQSVADFWPQYLRGQAYLRLRKGEEAAAEFRAILAARGQNVSSILYPLAHVGLARAATLTGNTAQARQAYDDFFAVWKDADADLRPLIEARADVRQLK